MEKIASSRNNSEMGSAMIWHSEMLLWKDPWLVKVIHRNKDYHEEVSGSMIN